MGAQPESSTHEVLADLVERVSYHNAENAPPNDPPACPAWGWGRKALKAQPSSATRGRARDRSGAYTRDYPRPTCGALYKVVPVEADPATSYGEITCRRCDGPLPGQSRGFLLNNFSVDRPRRTDARIVAQLS